MSDSLDDSISQKSDSTADMQAIGARGTATSLAMRYLNEPKRN